MDLQTEDNRARIKASRMREGAKEQHEFREAVEKSRLSSESWLGGLTEATKGYMKKRKLLQKLLAGSKNIRFPEAVSCAKAFGFEYRALRAIITFTCIRKWRNF